MKRIALCVLALLVACNDDDKKDDDNGPSLLSGHFVDSAVQHLHYQTATQSGETDIDGTFTYRAGETVTFSIGGIVIGTVPAGEIITPFNIFNVPPPTSLADFESFIAHYQGDNVDDFTRVVNLAVFLHSIDADSNPENGIDLTGRADAYANAALTFSMPVQEFTGHVLPAFIQIYGGGNQSLSVGSVLTSLYDTLKINVAFDVVATEVHDDGNDGTIDLAEERTYDANGRLATLALKDTSGVIAYVQVLTYDAAGNIKTDIRSSNPDGAGGYRSIASFAYEYTGGINTKNRYVETRDGATRNASSQTFTVDASGRVTQRVEEYQDTLDHWLRTTVITYDAATRTITETESNDNDADGLGDTREVRTSTVDTYGNEIRSTKDSDGNGTVDESDTTAFTYDANGRVTQSIREGRDGTGVVTDRTTKTWVYDANGRVTASTNVFDQDGTGANVTTDGDSFTYDDAGHLTQRTTSSTNKVATSSALQELTYTATGRIATDTTTYRRADDSIVAIYTYTYTYEAGSDHLLSQRFDDDGAGDGVDVKTDITTYTYTRVINGLNALLAIFDVQVT